MTVNRPFQRSHRKSASGSARAATERVSRVAKLMALAIQFDQLIREGAVADQAELANLGRVTRARVTQIMNLLNLAPEIQEHVLQLPRDGQRPRTERELRPIAATPDWRSQRRRWVKLLSKAIEP